MYTTLPVKMGSMGGFGEAVSLTDSLRVWCDDYPTLCLVHEIASTLGLALGAYHGYKRNNSVGWAIGWGLLGAMFPYITIPVAYAQGFGERA